MKEALHAVDTYTGVDESHIRRIRDSYSDAFMYLCTGCQYCDHCPEGIPVPKMMDAYNHYKLKGTKQAVLDRLKWHWEVRPGEADRCTECGQCEEACTQHLPIIKRLKEIAALAPSK